MERFIDNITNFEDLKEDVIDELIKDTEKLKKFFKRKRLVKIENFDRLENNFNELKRLAKDIIREMENKIMESEIDPVIPVKKFIKEIGVTRIKASVKKFTEQLSNFTDDVLIDADIEKLEKLMMDTESINKSAENFIKMIIKLIQKTENEDNEAPNFEDLMKNNKELVNKLIDEIELVFIFIEEVKKIND